MLTPTATPGLGRGWTRVADAVAQALPVEEIARIWIFNPLRREDREWGTALIAQQADGDRLIIHTARYMIITRGKQRGQGKVEVSAVGESPADVVHDVIRGVQDRSGETDPPTEIPVTLWYGEDRDEPATES